jgi:hypothetical protein
MGDGRVTERQYRRLLENRRAARPEPVLAGLVERRILGAAARNARRREAARRVLEGLVQAQWLEATRVTALDEHTLTVTVTDTRAWAGIRRQVRDLERRLAQRVPGVRRVVIRFAETDEEAEQRQTRGDDPA